MPAAIPSTPSSTRRWSRRAGAPAALRCPRPCRDHRGAPRPPASRGEDTPARRGRAREAFWAGGVAGQRSADEVAHLLHALERKGFIQRARRSSVADEREYGFLHLLVRDVAYGQIPPPIVPSSMSPPRAGSIRSAAATTMPRCLPTTMARAPADERRWSRGARRGGRPRPCGVRGRGRARADDERFRRRCPVLRPRSRPVAGQTVA